MSNHDSSADAKKKLKQDILDLVQKGKNLKLTADEIYRKLNEKIVGNERYKRAFSIVLQDALSENPSFKPMLVAGRSGSGKTHLIKAVEKMFNIPLKIIDATTLASTSYKGRSIDDELEEFFGTMSQIPPCSIIVFDEFDKLSEHATKDAHKSMSIQSELLTTIAGKKTGKIDTHKTLFIMLGAFAYASEMSENPPRLDKDVLMKYGFKNELLGRIKKFVVLDPPTMDDAIDIMLNHEELESFKRDLAELGFDVEITTSAYAELAQICLNPNYGYRVLGTVTSNLKETIQFDHQKGKVVVDEVMMRLAVK